jgi:hypothetical protein
LPTGGRSAAAWPSGKIVTVSNARTNGQHRETASPANHRLRLARSRFLRRSRAGFIVVHAGYSAGFLVLAPVAAAGLLVFWLAMPESKPRQPSVSAEQRDDRPGEAPVSAR